MANVDNDNDYGRKLRCVIVTPERALVDERADFVALPLFDGEIGFLPGRAPMVGRLGTGELRIRNQNRTQYFYVDSGFVQVRDNVVSVLTARAKRAEEIKVQEADQALQAAQAPNPGKAPEERLKAQERARAQLRVAEHATGVPRPGPEAHA
jgi:F-type H+-transporting ATPase subunit epsilon